MPITLLGELNLWTFDDNINIKNTDHGAFRYHDKRIDNVYEEGKRSYSQKRGMTYVPTNKKGNKLKDSIKHLEITTVYFTKPRRHPFDKISKLEPKLSTSDLFGSNGRRLDKKIQINKPGDLILIWWKSTMNEVYPWSPVVKEHDRANIHLYRLTGSDNSVDYF
ncbi:hypothetical protein M0802_009382 [Mischocyttarus mexicanus]|nr:hypothetical protein M0802_009382 [Mischocyttarus mexicanus]